MAFFTCTECEPLGSRDTSPHYACDADLKVGNYKIRIT